MILGTLKLVEPGTWGSIAYRLAVIDQTPSRGEMRKTRTVLSASLAALTLAAMTLGTSAASASSGEGGVPDSAYRVSITETVTSEVFKGGKSQGVEQRETYGEHYFNFSNPGYSGNDQYGHFTAQVKYGSQAKPPFAWGYKLHGGVSAAATGPMNETAVLYKNGKQTGYKDTHYGVPASYLVHSSTNVEVNPSYKLVIDEVFPIKNGERHIKVQFAFIVHTM
ncbi:hypothetical protein [Streptomyces syringium]|uniref:hypothetical protein n=1 Tax=Streptomyces syringium TaxID=76729 RepID=UPI0034357F37